MNKLQIELLFWKYKLQAKKMNIFSKWHKREALSNLGLLRSYENVLDKVSWKKDEKEESIKN